MIQELKKQLVDFAYPPFCVACSKDGAWLCTNCIQSILDTEPPRFKPPGFTDFFTIGRYANPALRQLIHSLKYRGASCCLSSVSELIQRFTDANVLFERTLHLSGLNLFFVPSDDLRVRERGIDHARSLAEVFTGTYKHIILQDSLIKTRSIMPNASLPSNAARKGNTADAFTVTDRIHGPCLLIDDVYTTGATMQACRSAMKKGGASEVYGFALARG